MTPPLEDAPVNGEQVIKIGFPVLLLSTPQNVVVSTGDDGDGIDLYIPEPAKDSGSAVGTRVGREGAIQTLCLEGESAGLCKGDSGWRCCITIAASKFGASLVLHSSNVVETLFGLRESS